MVYYEPVKITIDALGLAKVIINVVIKYHNFSNFIVINCGSLFTSKFWSLLYNFLGIKQKLFTAFYLQTDGQTERQNSIIKAYLQIFVNFKQNNWARFFLMVVFAYNIAKNANTSYILFELNCRYYPGISFEKDLDPRSKSKTIKELFSKLQKLMVICQQNLYHAQELQNRAHNKEIKPQSYALGNKVWLSSKHLRIKRNRKLEAKFLCLFQVLYLVGKQAYKLRLS